MEQRNEFGLLSDAILDSGVFQKFIEYIIDLHTSWDLLQYLYEEGVENETSSNEVTIHNRPFFKEFLVEVNNKTIPPEYFLSLEKRIHIQELIEKKCCMDSCVDVYMTLADKDAQKTTALRKILFDILVNEKFIENYAMLYPNLMNLRDLWLKTWADVAEKISAANSGLTKEGLILEVNKRKHFVMECAAFYIASAIGNVVQMRTQGIFLSWINIKNPDFDSKNIYKAAIEKNQDKGIVKYYHQDGLYMGYFAIKPMALFCLNKEKEPQEKSSDSCYIRTEKSFFLPGTNNPAKLNSIQLHSLNKKFNKHQNIPRLNNSQLHAITMTTGDLQSCILHEITDLEFGKRLLQKFDGEESLFVTPKEDKAIFDVFCGSGLSWLNKLDLESIKQEPCSQYIRTKYSLYYYHKWEDRLEELSKDAERLKLFDEKFKPSKKSLFLSKEQSDGIFAIIGCGPTLIPVYEEKKDLKSRNISLPFFGKLTSSGSSKSHDSSPRSSSVSPRSSPHSPHSEDEKPRKLTFSDSSSNTQITPRRLSEKGRKKRSLTPESVQPRKKTSPRPEPLSASTEILPDSAKTVEKPIRETRSLPEKTGHFLPT